MRTGKKNNKQRTKSARKLVDITNLLPSGTSAAKKAPKRKKNFSKTKVVFEPVPGLNEEASIQEMQNSLTHPGMAPGTAPNTGPGTGPNTGPGTAPGTGSGTTFMS